MAYGRDPFGTSTYSATSPIATTLSSTATADATTTSTLTQVLNLSGTAAVTVTTTASLTVSEVLFADDLSYVITFSAGLDVKVPAPEPPPGFHGEVYPIPRVSPVMPIPVLDENGRPT